MFAELLFARRTRRMFRAFEAKDADEMLRPMGPDLEMEFPAGLPITGRWRGDQLKAVLRSIMALNETLQLDLEEIVVDRPWSPLGRMRIYSLWSVVQTGHDGSRVTSDVVSVTEVQRWRPVRTRELYSNVPGLARHLEPALLPAVPTT